jgi:hypothetical protein
MRNLKRDEYEYGTSFWGAGKIRSGLPNIVNVLKAIELYILNYLITLCKLYCI